MCERVHKFDNKWRLIEEKTLAYNCFLFMSLKTVNNTNN